MTSSAMPQEIMTWYLLPAIRKDMAEAMLKSGMNQREVARKLGITDAAISQYLSGKRAHDVKLDPNVRRLISLSARKVIGGADVMQEIKLVCEYCTTKLVLCRLHRAHGAPRKCDLCFKSVKKR